MYQPGRQQTGRTRRISDAVVHETSEKTEEGMEQARERGIPRGARAGRREARSEAGEAGKGPDLPVILAATDGSVVSLRAGEHTVRLAEELGARLVVLYVVDEDAAFHAGIHYGDAVAEFVLDGRGATAKVASLAAEGGVECPSVFATSSCAGTAWTAGHRPRSGSSPGNWGSQKSG